MLSNCKKCGKVFSNNQRSVVGGNSVPTCLECVEKEEEQFTKLYRMLQKSAREGGISVDDVSKQLEMPIQDIEALYWSGRLGTAGTCLMFHCQGCGLLMRELQRKGRFCVNCSEKTAEKAGVEVRTVQSIAASEAEQQKKQQLEALLKKNQKPATSPTKAKGYGFSTR